MGKKQIAVKEREEALPEEESLIDRIYLSKKGRLEMLEGADAKVHIKAIQDNTNGNDEDYTFYEDGRPVYFAIQNGQYSPLVFPLPGSKVKEGQMGYTSIQLYGWAVTLAGAIEKIIELLTEPKPSLIDQARKIMTPTIVVVASIIGVFLIVAMMGG